MTLSLPRISFAVIAMPQELEAQASLSSQLHNGLDLKIAQQGCQLALKTLIYNERDRQWNPSSNRCGFIVL